MVSIKSAQFTMNMNKAAEFDGIVMEILLVLDNFGIDQITEVINEISDGSNIPEELNKCIFEARPIRHENCFCTSVKIGYKIRYSIN